MIMKRLKFIAGSPQDHKRLERMVAEVLSAKRRGEKAQNEVYRRCREIEESGLYSLTGMSWPRFLRDAMGVSGGAYASYSNAARLLGEKRVEALGATAARSVAALQGPVEKIQAIADEVASRISGFLSDKGFSPSSTYVQTFIREAAVRIGISLPPKRMSASEKLRRAISCLRQIAESTNVSTAPTLAADCLTEISDVRVAQDEAA